MGDVELRAIRGRDQRGISFVSPGDWNESNKIAVLSLPRRTVYSDIRLTDRAPSGHIVIDAKLYDSLSCSNEEIVSVIPKDIEPRACKELTIEVRSLAGIENERVRDAIAERIEDLRPHLDGLIVAEGQQIELHGLSLRLTIVTVSLLESEERIGRISWPRLESIRLIGGRIPRLNAFVILTEMSHSHSLGSGGTIMGFGDTETPPYADLLMQFLMGLKAFSTSHSTDIVASVAAYSSRTDVFLTFNPDSGEQQKWSNIDSPAYLEAVRSWLLEQKENHSSQPSNPSSALEEAFLLVHQMRDDGLSPVSVVLLTTGRYSEGRNPVSILRDGPEDLTVFSLGLQSASDEDMLDAISEASAGKAFIVGGSADLRTAIENMIQILGRRMSVDD
ncbi:hypothetical protein EU538_01585 [Candidatus Thorarchaeota archaeon]|nr:MAG: hypothetical protein EU538_01585 [Candidatus Thorarchaeota archaeon]